jgi:N-acetylglucosaminyldiphosphoundecaprenol N-acetyl-beta-D-mannosaminyltransferase
MAELARRWVRRPMFGLQIDAMRMQDLVALAESAILARRRLLIGVVNAAKIVHLRSDAVLRESLLECDVLVADGQSVVWAGRALGEPLPERIAGIDLFEELLALADREQRSVFLLGARPEVLHAVEQAIATRWPRARVAGARDGYFDDADSGLVAAEIASSGADMLFIAMPSPRKETFLATHGPRLGVPVLHGVGGSFDVLGGLTRRAPERWQRWGLEWLHRVLQEPGRLWQRYLTTNTAFLVLLLRERIHRSRPYVPSTATEGATS